MPAVSLREILQPAFAARYGVGAFNIVNDLTMAAVLDAAVEVKSPVIIQVSVKTVKMWGARLLQQMFAEMAFHRSIPATLHLDHCPDIEMIKTCFEAGWNSALYDASSLSYQDNLRLCKEVVALAKKHGAGVEGVQTGRVDPLPVTTTSMKPYCFSRLAMSSSLENCSSPLSTIVAA